MLNIDHIQTSFSSLREGTSASSYAETTQNADQPSDRSNASSLADVSLLCNVPFLTINQYDTTFAIENAPPNIPYERMVKKTIRMKKPIHQCLGQLPITSTTARFHFGMNGKKVFDDSHVTWCQTLKCLF